MFGRPFFFLTKKKEPTDIAHKVDMDLKSAIKHLL